MYSYDDELERVQKKIDALKKEYERLNMDLQKDVMSLQDICEYLSFTPSQIAELVNNEHINEYDFRDQKIYSKFEIDFYIDINYYKKPTPK